jgi:ferric-dicitrate binding protein FerR (iron transport regulator)
MPSNEVDRQLLLTYLEGNCSGDQLRQIKEYLTDETYRDSLNKFMQEEWEWLSAAGFPALPGMSEQYAKFRFYLVRREDGTNKRPVPPSRVRRLYAFSAAAAALLLIISAWVLRALYNKHHTQELAAAEVYYHNGPGQKTTVQLPDSSRVYLGPASTLRFKQEKNGNRLVLLEGQAFFEVKHHEHRPFTVRTGAIATVDVGTAFNIRYYPGDPSIEVVVSSGRVQVLHKKDEADTPLALLNPGQQLEYDTVTQHYGITTVANTELAGAWRKGILSFRRERLKEVTDELQRYYGVRFQYNNPDAENILLTTLLDNKNLEDALDIVTLTAGIQFTRQGNLIILK